MEKSCVSLCFTYWRPSVSRYALPEPDNDASENSPNEPLPSAPTYTTPSGPKGPVVGLRVNFKDEKNRSASQIEGLLVMQLQDELIRLGLPSNFTLEVKNLRKTTP
ncbi:hypothetical protein NFI96_014280 [Prochilodus magdalenae]|nr:hypothetical protein NFI96_014280 [Prochilodus magdalenae]